MPKKGENIYKRKDGRWEGRYIRYYQFDGKPKFAYVYAKSYSEVKQKMFEQRSLNIECINQPMKKITYGDLLDIWLKFVKINIKESTYSRYVFAIEQHIKPYLGNYPIQYLSTHLIEKYIQDKLFQGRLDGEGGLSPKTVSDQFVIIKSSIKYARERDYPITCHVDTLTIKKKYEKEIRVFNQEEQERLIKVLLKDIDLYKFGILLSLYTGIRIGELCALRWENISLSHRVLKVRETLQRIGVTSAHTTSKTKIIITEPKSKSSIRNIPIPNCIIDIAKQFQNDSHAFVLTGKKDKYIEPRIMQYHFHLYMRECDIHDAHFHTLRHTFATRCVEIGFEIKSLSEILGHANVNITLNRYVHSSFQLKCINMDKLTL